MAASTTRVLLWGVVLLLDGGSLAAQVAPNVDTSPPSTTNPSIFAPLTLLPAPSATRLATGTPGPEYWQNRTDYDLHATLDTATGTVQGHMTLRYTNHSPNTLPFLWFRNRWLDHITELINGKPVAVSLGEQPGDRRTETAETKVTLPQPLNPGGTATFTVSWHFIVPQYAGDMGRDGSLYLLGDWYPHVNVYDDVVGWNTVLRSGTDYSEFGNFTLAITVPADYIIAATGVLDNPQDVLTSTERARLSQAAHADTVIPIVTAEELRTGAAHLRHGGLVTWKFHATNIQDAAFGASPQYQWDATSWKGILAQAYYRPPVDSTFREAAAMARVSIQEYSERWYPYPYPQVSVVEAPSYSMIPGMQMGGGVAYSMLAFLTGGYNTITHEVGHNWFQRLVGANEQEKSWMSEGFNTFINSFSIARHSPEQGTQDAHIEHQVYTGTGTPIVVGDPYNGTAYALELLRRDVLGPAVFDKAFRTYIRRWAYKHATPADFFRAMEHDSGCNLAWFWRENFLEGPRFDQAINSVRQTMQGDETHVTVTYGNRGRAVFPLLVRFTFSDGTTQDVTYPADIWRANSTQYTATYTFAKKTVRRIVLDPDTHLPDADRSNNVWTTP